MTAARSARTAAGNETLRASFPVREPGRSLKLSPSSRRPRHLPAEVPLSHPFSVREPGNPLPVISPRRFFGCTAAAPCLLGATGDWQNFPAWCVVPLKSLRREALDVLSPSVHRPVCSHASCVENSFRDGQLRRRICHLSTARRLKCRTRGFVSPLAAPFPASEARHRPGLSEAFALHVLSLVYSTCALSPQQPFLQAAPSVGERNSSPMIVGVPWYQNSARRLSFCTGVPASQRSRPGLLAAITPFRSQPMGVKTSAP